MINLIDTNLPSTFDGFLVTQIDSFLDCLTTPKKSVVHNLDYGTDLHKLKHRSFNTAWIIDFKRCLKDACKYDNRLDFKNAYLDDSDIATGVLRFEVQISQYFIKGSVDV